MTTVRKLVHPRDEGLPVSTPTSSVVAPPNSAIQDARLRSPPPPVQTFHPPPPVPPLPPRLRPHRHPHVFPPDVIRPNAEPFAFERVIAPHVTRPQSNPPLGNVPPPRHHPIINLGGGFIPTNHQFEAEFIRRQQARDRARQRYFDHLRIARGIHQRHGFLSQTIGRIFPSLVFGDPTEEEMMDALAFSEFATEAGPFGFGDDPIRRPTHEYRIAYTHPYPPTPGFTHNFESPSPSVSVIDVDDEPGPSTKASGSSSSSKNNESLNTLVCARCLDPLVLGGSSMPEDERIRRRLWGLRCGHMLDGKCIAELMKPRLAPNLEPASTEAVAIEPPHSRSQGPDSSTHSQDGAPSLVVDGAMLPDAKTPPRLAKARGKARAIEQLSQPSQPTEDAGERTAFAEDNSIRSRLRPRNNLGHVTHIPSSSPTSSYSSAQASSQRSSATIAPALPPAPAANTSYHFKKRARGKGKQKAMEPAILERHEWRCPVPLCERPHLSLNIETRGWVMDETQGAIPIFA